MSQQGYRESHQAKGNDYHESFSNVPHRAMLWRLEQKLLDRIVGRYFGGSQPKSYLDFACGTGRILQHVSRLTASATGVDISASMLDVARRNVPSAEIIEADLTREDPLGERRFELITAFRFFPNAEPELRDQVMSVLAGHLADDGFLIFNNHKHDRSLARRIAIGLGHIDPDATTDEPLRVMSRDEVDHLVTSSGLRIVSQHPLAALPFTDLHMMRPAWLLEAAETGLARVPGAASIAQNLVYVCRSGEAR